MAKEFYVVNGYHSRKLIFDNPNYSNLKIDITQADTLKKIKKDNPQVIIHAAALTDLEFCEKNPEIAYNVNVKGTKNIFDVAKKCNTKLIYICTDYIFDGGKGDYREEDKPNPLSVYAKTKLEGETLIENYDNFLSIRTSLYGWALSNARNFSSWVINTLRDNNTIFVAKDQISSFIFTNDLAKILIKMIEKDLSGIYNVASENSISKYNFALLLAKEFGLDEELITPITLDQLMKKFNLIARRPKNTSLNGSKVRGELRKLPGFRDGIKKMKRIEEEFFSKLGVR